MQDGSQGKENFVPFNQLVQRLSSSALLITSLFIFPGGRNHLLFTLNPSAVKRINYLGQQGITHQQNQVELLSVYS
ncbi:unnamed protein product [Paramecium octaurelia]|uniref:Uncharacterized protein n=1 Tax=Paramecium octaurelia TaxID=43137 RepID=A0A8S1V2E3_PAROT|nr:unnamed protein product [Paramecium octaurelia]